MYTTAASVRGGGSTSERGGRGRGGVARRPVGRRSGAVPSRGRLRARRRCARGPAREPLPAPSRHARAGRPPSARHRARAGRERMVGCGPARADGVTLVLLVGGARSGKSALALRLAERERAPVVFVATGEAGDDEMAARIARHRAERPAGWRTVEEPLDLGRALAEVEDDACVLV